MKNQNPIITQSQPQPTVPTAGTSNKTGITPSPALNTAPVVIVTEVQPSPSPPTPAQLPTAGASSPIIDLATLGLVLIAFVAVVTVAKQ